MADYAYNYDRVGCSDGFPNWNLVHNTEDISDNSGEVTEPVTLSEMKDYLRLQAWDNSGEFDFDDDLLLSMITSGREFCEAKTGCSLVPKTIKAFITNGLGMLSLPKGPVTGDVTILNEAEVAIDAGSIKLFGTKFPQLRLPVGNNLTVTYDAGYTTDTIPEGLRNAIKAFVVYVYEHRGDELEKQEPQQAATLCKPFIKYGPYG